MDRYEVAFVVEGRIDDYDAPLGCVECNGVEPEFDCDERPTGKLLIRDGRAYYDVEADSPLEARDKAETYFEADDVGDLEVLHSKLEHVSLGDTYWYEEDLREMERERDR